MRFVTLLFTSQGRGYNLRLRKLQGFACQATALRSRFVSPLALCFIDAMRHVDDAVFVVGVKMSRF